MMADVIVHKETPKKKILITELIWCSIHLLGPWTYLCTFYKYINKCSTFILNRALTDFFQLCLNGFIALKMSCVHQPQKPQILVYRRYLSNIYPTDAQFSLCIITFCKIALFWWTVHTQVCWYHNAGTTTLTHPEGKYVRVWCLYKKEADNT